MKITTLILLTTLLQVSAATFGQKVTIVKNDIALSEVFKEIRKQTGYNVLWQPGKVNGAKTIDLNIKNQDLDDALDLILKGRGLEYSIEEETVMIKPQKSSFLDRVVSSFVDIGVNGVVLDSAGKPLPGASVTVKGTLKATTTGDGGSFYLKDVKEGSILVVSYVGYETQEVKASDAINKILYIRMVASAGKLQEVIINAGYYTVKESQRTGSISRITAKEIEKQPVSNILAAMQGQMAGVNITQVTGNPGGGFRVEIRGRNSLRTGGSTSNPLGNEPLYIVDGMPYSSQQMSSNNTSMVFTGAGPSPLNGINPADIESVEILKDADATAIYGSRGANGVVLITTKKGKPGKTDFSVNVYKGASSVSRKIDLMNTQQYLEMRKEAFANDGVAIPSYANDLRAWDQNRYTDWQKELIGGVAHTNNINAQVSGGNSNTTFLLGGTYYKEGTVFPGKYGYEKDAALLNVNHKSNDQRFILNLSLQYLSDKNKLPGTDLTPQAVSLAPNAPALYKENGDLNWENLTWTNPLANLERKYLSDGNTLTTGGILNYKILPGLEIKSTLGFTDRRLVDLYTSPNTQYPPEYLVYYPSETNSSLVMNNSKQQSWNIEPQLNWNKHIGKGIFNVLAGTTFQKSTFAQIVNIGSGFTSNSLITNLSAALRQVVLNNNSSEYRYNAIFGRINYALEEKYFINLTARRDGSSRFGPGKQFGNFGAIGLSWLFSKEKFINKLLPSLSFGRLRGSYGTTGSDNLPDYGYLNTYTINQSDGYQGGSKGLSPTQLYNPDFSWATTKKLEMAIDLGFVNDRIFFSAAHYRNRSSDQLIGYQLPGTTGFPSINANLDATVQNTGWEFELRTTNIDSKLRWLTSLNFTIPRNKLISFPNLAGSTYANQYVIGAPLNILKVFHYTGVNPTTGIYQFEDYDGSGTISDLSDTKMIIDLSPKYQGGITNSLTYKNFAFDFTVQFVKQQGSTYGGGISTPGSIANQPVEVINRWQNVGDNKPVQKYTALEGSDLTAYYAYSNFSRSDAVYSDASFIRLKNLSFAYVLPKSKIKVASCRIFIQGQNLLTITKYKGLDPENMSLGVLPPLRTITLGLQLNF